MEPMVTQLRSGDLGFEPSSVSPQNSCSSPLRVWLGQPELVTVPGEFLMHPLRHLRPILFCTLGWTSRFLRNTALINYSSWCGHICLSRGSFPSEWNMLESPPSWENKAPPPWPHVPFENGPPLFPTTAVYLITPDERGMACVLPEGPLPLVPAVGTISVHPPRLLSLCRVLLHHSHLASLSSFLRNRNILHGLCIPGLDILRK